MEIVFTVLILLMTVALSGVVTKMVPFHIPLPLMQIAIGAALAVPAFGLHIALDPEVFMLLFIPPLLFADGWRIPKRDFFRQHFVITMMALGLVLFTVLGGGLLVNWLIPSIPLPAAFALTAVLSPTDAVALSGIVGRGRLPRGMMGLLEGEALMNDASGLVALKFAVAAMLTGAFSLSEASVEFLFVAVGGLVVGVAISWLSMRVSQWADRFVGDDPVTRIVALLLLPFVVYIIAEKIGVSGILAAVAAGIMQSYSKALEGSLLTRLQNDSVWDMLESVFNGMVFILLGLQLPHIIGHLPRLVEGSVIADGWVMLFYVVAVGLILMALRFVWVWLLMRFLVWRAARRNEPQKNSGTVGLLIVTMAGVRGAVTLAGVLSIPLLLKDGSPFPARDALVFLAAGVILFSLLCAAISLPLLIRYLPGGGEANNDSAKVILQQRAEAAVAAVEAIRKTHAKEVSEAAQSAFEEACVRVLGRYRDRLSDTGGDEVSHEHARQVALLENQMRLTALRAERTTLYRLRSQRTVDEEALREQLGELDLTEIALIKQSERMAKVEGVAGA